VADDKEKTAAESVDHAGAAEQSVENATHNVAGPDAQPAGAETVAANGVADGAAAGGKDSAAAADAEEAGEDEDVEYVEESVVVIRRPVFVALAVAAVALIVALGAANLYQWKKGDAAVATVNGAKITRADYDKAVARGDGGDVLDNLINQKLVQLDAKKKGIAVTVDEVDAKLKAEKQQIGSDSDWQQALDQQHTTELQVRDNIRLNLMVQKLVLDKVAVSDTDIQQFFDQNKDTQFKDKTLDQVKDQIKSQLQDDKQQQALGDYLSGLKSAAHISRHLPGA